MPRLLTAYVLHMSTGGLRQGTAPTLIAAAATGAAGLVVALLVNHVGASWASWRRATCLGTHCFCELPRSGFPRQPVDAWTSFAYAASGCWIYMRGRTDVRARGLLGNFIMPALAIIAVFIGLSSFFFHATLTFIGQYLDVTSMYVFGAFLASVALWRRGAINSRTAIATFVVVVLSLGYAQYEEPDLRRYLFALLLLPGLIFELDPRLAQRTDVRALIFVRVGFVALVVAYVFWVLDQTGNLCDPSSIFQGHGLWHILTAAGVLLLGEHYLSTWQSARLPRERHA